VYKYVERIAGTLRAAGVRPGTVLAVVSPPCLEAVCFFMAAQWIGAIAAPLPPTLGAAALARALTAVGARAVASLADEAVATAAADAADAAGVLSWHLTRSVNEGVGLDVRGRFAAEGAAWKGGAADFTIDPEEVAVHLLTGWEGDADEEEEEGEGAAPPPTSGAGDPDAPLSPAATVVRLTHAMVAAAAVSFARAYGLATGHTTVLAHGLHDANGVVELIAALYSGGHLVVPPPPVSAAVAAASAPPPTLPELAAKHDADWLALPPSAAAGLALSPPIPSLKCVRVTRPGGAGVASAAGAPVLPAWCPPEAVGVGALVSAADPAAGLRPPSDLQVAAVERGEDGTWARLPPGESGILAVRGPSVAASRGAAGAAAAAEMAAPFSLPDEATAAAEADRDAADNEAEGSDGGDGGGGGGGSTTAGGPAVEGPGRGPSIARLWMPTADRGAVDAYGVVTVDSAASRREAAAAAAAAAAAEEAARVAQEQEAEATRVAKEQAEADSAKAAEAAAVAAAAAAAASAAAAAAAAQAKADAEAKEAAARAAEEASRSLTDTDEGALDGATAAAILGRLEAIESNHAALEAELVAAHNAELADLQRRLAEAEAAAAAAADSAERSATVGSTVVATVPSTPVVMDVRMDAVEACAMAAAASAEDAHQQTAAAVAAAKAIAESAFGLTIDQGGQMRLAPGGGAVGAAAAAASRSVPSVGGLLVGNTGEQTGLVKRVEVSLVEVEAALRSHPAVADARAFGRTDTRTGAADVHVAFVTLPGARVSEPWLRLHAQSMLPSTMVPRKFYQVDSLPADASRAALAASTGLRDMSGYTGVNAAHLHVKQPAWRPAIKAPKKVPAG